jgi:hypothetical protein
MTSASIEPKALDPSVCWDDGEDETALKGISPKKNRRLAIALLVFS